MSAEATAAVTPVDLADVYNRVVDAAQLALNAKTAVTFVIAQVDDMSRTCNALIEPPLKKIRALTSLALDQMDRAEDVLDDLAIDLPDPNTELRSRFNEWERRKLASCRFRGTDEEAYQVMDKEGDALAAFVELPASSADEVLLKVYALALNRYNSTQHMAPSAPEGQLDEERIWRGIITDLSRVSETVRRAIKSGEMA